MAAKPRRDYFDPRVRGIYHCSSRCVRRAFLCGKDKYNKKDYEHRRAWVEERIRELARWFAIDVMFMAIMGNHLHMVLRNLPELVAKWSDREVIKRSCKIYPSKFKELGVVDGKPTPEQYKKFIANKKLMEDLRLRLSDISWFNRQLKQHIARKANAEEEKTGHFFEGRFRCVVVTDEKGLLICGIYVDLNQIRAQEADTPEKSRHTSVYFRIVGLKARKRGSDKAAEKDGFLTPINTRGDGQLARMGYQKAGSFGSRRASDVGVLKMSLEEYLELLDWCGRQVRRDKRGKIPADAPPILERLGLTGESLVEYAENYPELFKVAVGSAESLAEFAETTGRKWLQGNQARADVEES